MNMWCSSSYTETGLIRSENEDAVLKLDEQQLWLVADGMGGHTNGRYASQLVIQSFADFQYSPLPGVNKQRIERTLNNCNSQLVEKANSENASAIGCTVALLQARRRSVVCSWSGDSRIYRLRGEELTELTRDHSQQCAVEDRDRFRYPSAQYDSSQMLINAIGGYKQLVLEHCWYELRTGDKFLLCTDGLNKEVSDDEIRTAMIESSNCEQTLEALARLYQQRGARDNVGMVTLREAPI